VAHPMRLRSGGVAAGCNQNALKEIFLQAWKPVRHDDRRQDGASQRGRLTDRSLSRVSVARSSGCCGKSVKRRERPDSDLRKQKARIGMRAFVKLSARPARKLERAKGLEPSTPTLARSCSTTELHPHPRWRRSLAGNGRAMPNAHSECNTRA